MSIRSSLGGYEEELLSCHVGLAFSYYMFITCGSNNTSKVPKISLFLKWLRVGSLQGKINLTKIFMESFKIFLAPPFIPKKRNL